MKRRSRNECEGTLGRALLFSVRAAKRRCSYSLCFCIVLRKGKIAAISVRERCVVPLKMGNVYKTLSYDVNDEEWNKKPKSLLQRAFVAPDEVQIEY